MPSSLRYINDGGFLLLYTGKADELNKAPSAAHCMSIFQSGVLY